VLGNPFGAARPVPDRSSADRDDAMINVGRGEVADRAPGVDGRVVARAAIVLVISRRSPRATTRRR